MKPRPSPFRARWLGLLVGVGLAVSVGLAVGPPIVNWARNPSVRQAVKPGPTRIEPRPMVPGHAEARRPEPEAAGPRAGRAEAGPAPGRPVATGTPSAAADAGRPAGSGRASPTYRVQIGAFADQQNADRLAARLRQEALEVVTSTVEQPRELYRVVAQSPKPDDGGPSLARLKKLGLIPDAASDGAVVSAAAPLRDAVALSRRLREAGVAVRLDRVSQVATLRIVRVGRFSSGAGAEGLRAQLARRGLEGFVVREP